MGAAGTKHSGMGTRTRWDGISWKIPKVGDEQTSSPRVSRKVKFSVSASRLAQNTGHHSSVQTKASDLHSLNQFPDLQAGCKGSLKEITCACAAYV